MKIADGIEMLEISGTVMGSPRTINPTLLWDDQAQILVDTGFPGQLELIRSAVKKADRSFDNLNTLVLTHQDIDHIGNLSVILGALPKPAQVFAHEQEIPYIEGSQTPHKLAQLEAALDHLPQEQKDMYERLRASFASSAAPVPNALSAGQELPQAGGLRVLYTPGHTVGHICLYHRPSKTLIAGDALRIEDGRLVPPPPAVNFDTGLALKSLEQLTDFDIQAVICYHGGLYADDPNQRIAALAGA